MDAELDNASNPRVLPYETGDSAPPGGSVTTPPSVTYPIQYSTTADIAVEEDTAPVADPQILDQYVNILGADVHSAGEIGFAFAPLGPASSGTVYSYERWIRLRFQPPFNTVYAIRVWAPEVTLADGWTLTFGTTDTYATPVTTASTIATDALPDSDPGLDDANLIGADRLDGSGTDDQYSLWLVLQLAVDTEVAEGGQPVGYLAESSRPLPLKLQFAWVDT
jgi:hypothetical protein